MNKLQKEHNEQINKNFEKIFKFQQNLSQQLLAATCEGKVFKCKNILKKKKVQ